MVSSEGIDNDDDLGDEEYDKPSELPASGKEMNAILNNSMFIGPPLTTYFSTYLLYEFSVINPLSLCVDIAKMYNCGVSMVLLEIKCDISAIAADCL